MSAPPPGAPAVPPARRSPLWLAGAVFVAVAFSLYGVSLNAPPQFDDYRVFAGQTADEVWAQARTPRRTLANVSFALNYWLHGPAVTGYHAVNVLLHALAALGLFALVRRLAPPAVARRAAWAGALVFLCHPLATQAVTYVCQRYAVLAGLFMIWSLAAYAAFRRPAAGPAGGGPPRAGLFVAAVACAVAAVFSKEYAVGLPVLALAVEWLCCGQPREPWPRRLLYLVPFLAVAALVPLQQWGANPPAAAGAGLLPDWSATTIPRSVYLLTEWKVIAGIYLRLLVWPVGQSVDHQVTLADSLRDPAVLAAGALLVALLGAALWAGRRWPLLTLGVLALYAGLAPTSTFVPNSEVVAEQRLYLGVAGLGLVVAAGVAACRWRPALGVALAAYLFGLGVLTVSRNRLWNDELALWQDALAKGPALPRPPFAVGEAHRRRGAFAAAEAYYRRSLAIRADYRPALQNLGVVLEAQGRNLEALEVYRQFLGRWPDDVAVLGNVALLLHRLGRLDQARLAGERVLRLAPAHPGALLDLAQVEAEAGNRARARALLQQLLAGRPDAPAARVAQVLLGQVCEQDGDLAAAAAAYAAAQAAAPRDAALHLRRGSVLRRLGRGDDAQAALEQAVALGAPGVGGEACLELARLCRDRGDATGAASQYRRARDHGAGPDPAFEPAPPAP